MNNSNIYLNLTMMAEKSEHYTFGAYPVLLRKGVKF